MQFTVEIERDPDAMSPRENDNLGEILYLEGSRYVLGDRAVSREEIDEIVRRKDVYCLPVYAYIHGGVTLNTTGYSCPWDSGQCGIVYADFDRVREHVGDPNSQDTAQKTLAVLRSEIEVYDRWIKGEFYQYAIKKGDEVVESLCGIDDLDYCRKECLRNLSYLMEEECA